MLGQAERWAETVPLSTVDIADFDAVVCPGGHGPPWDFADDANSIAVLRHPKDSAGVTLIRGKRVTGLMPIPPACLGATLELGSNDDVDPERAADQAAALLRMVQGRGFVDESGGRPRLSCSATALTAMAQLRSPVTGLVAYRRRLGDWVHKGDLVAPVIDPLGEETALRAETDGRFFARHSQPYTWPGRVIGKIAGEIPLDGRTGNLLSD